MAGEEQQHKDQKIGGEEVEDRGMFDFMAKKKENECHDQEVIVTEFDKVKVEEEKKKEEFNHKLHGSDSSSSSSEEEEEGENVEKKKKKKKGLKEKISGEKKEGEEEEKKEDTNVTVEKVDCTTEFLSSPVENKGFLDKIKEKLPGHSPKKTTEETAPPSEHVAQTAVRPPAAENEPKGAKEKKGLLGKIMDKIPGYHKGNNETAEQGGPTHQ